jgi:hypothetical protein
MENAFRSLTIFALATVTFAFLLGPVSPRARAQMHERDLLEPMLPGRPTPAIPGGQTTPKPPSPVRPGASLGILPGGHATPLPIPDPPPPALPVTPPPVPTN